MVISDSLHICRKFTILVLHDQLPSGLVAQLVEQRWPVPGGRGFQSHRGQKFFVFPCGPISFLGLTLRRYEHFSLPHLNHYICLIVLSGQTLLVTPSL